MAVYQPHDKEAHDLLVYISRWAREYCHHEGPLTRMVLDIYFNEVGSRRWREGIENRILTEQGKRGGFEAAQARERRVQRQRAEADKARQYTLLLAPTKGRGL